MTTGSLVSGWRLLLRSRQRSTPMTEVTQPPSPWSADDARVARTSHQHTKHRNVSQGTEWAVSQPPRTWTRLALCDWQSARRGGEEATTVTALPPAAPPVGREGGTAGTLFKTISLVLDATLSTCRSTNLPVTNDSSKLRGNLTVTALRKELKTRLASG